jgi:hypothetical protein
MWVRWLLNVLSTVTRRICRTLTPFLLFLGSVVFLQGSCTCTGEAPLPPEGVLACKPQHPTLPPASPSASDMETASAGTLPVTQTCSHFRFTTRRIWGGRARQLKDPWWGISQ